MDISLDRQLYFDRLKESTNFHIRKSLSESHKMKFMTAIRHTKHTAQFACENNSRNSCTHSMHDFSITTPWMFNCKMSWDKATFWFIFLVLIFFSVISLSKVVCYFIQRVSNKQCSTKFGWFACFYWMIVCLNVNEVQLFDLIMILCMFLLHSRSKHWI